MSMYYLLQKLSEDAADQIALCNESQKITYRQLFHIVCTNSGIIRKYFQYNDAVTIETENKFEFVISFISYILSGVWCVPIPTDIKENMVEEIRGKYKLLEPLKRNELVYEDDSIPFDTEAFQNVAETGIYHLTSGSTGVPKLCVRSIKALISEGENYQKTLAIKEKERIICLAPVNHSFALGAGLMASLVSGATLYLIDKFTPRKAVNSIASYHANIAIAVPAMIQTMNKVRLLEDLKFEDLRIILVGAGPVSIPEQSKFKNRFGIYISGNYGSTETGGLFTRQSDSFSQSIGISMNGIEVKLLNSNKQEVKKGEVGELYVKCPYSMQKYYMSTEDMITNDGFLPMGDLVKEDFDGQYYVVGRLKKIIRIGGKQVNPYEVEQCILKYPEIEDVYVYESKRGDEESIVAASIVGKNVNEICLRKYLSNYIESYKIPTKIQFLTAITRNSAGKIVQQGEDTNA